MSSIDLGSLHFDAKVHLASFQGLLSMARETLPQLSAVETRKSLRAFADQFDLQFVEKEGLAPTFLLLPPEGATPALTVFGTWHAESHSVTPAAVEGGGRLALAASLGALSALVQAGLGPPAVVLAPGALQGSLVLEGHLRAHRAALQAPVAFWPRIAPTAARRRRVYLGARGKVVLGIWGESANAYAIRDAVVAELRDEAYGPRPLDFELLRKLSQGQDALDFLEETIDDPGAVNGEGETKLRNALFEPRGQVLRPPVRHPDRPQAWLILEIAESMEPADVARRVQAIAGDAKIEMAEGFHWDRLNIHHAAVQAEIQTSKSLSEGADIWPMAPWVTPSGLFTRALGLPLAEWGVPLPPGTAIRFPSSDSLERIERELAELFLRGAGSLEKAVEEA